MSAARRTPGSTSTRRGQYTLSIGAAGADALERLVAATGYARSDVIRLLVRSSTADDLRRAKATDLHARAAEELRATKTDTTEEG